jgi:hypothetical protein
MKTSNKILLGTFFTLLFIILAVHITLYAKYKKGDYTLVSDDMWPTNMITYSLENVKYVSLDNIENITVSTSDSNKLQYDKADEGDENILSVIKKDDTLFLSGKSATRNEGRWYRTTHLSLAGLLPLKVTNSQIHVGVSAKKSRAPLSMDIMLDRSFMDVNNRHKNALSFGTFKINAINKSRIDLYNLTTNFLDVKLDDSFLKENTLTADSIRVITDPDSKLELTGKNLVKAKIISNE